jgi:tRNA threonylcarbamoyladenosine biosynthesis protein TsaB
LAADALGIARRRLEMAEFDDVTTLDANYLRRTDAEIFAKHAAAQA